MVAVGTVAVERHVERARGVEPAHERDVAREREAVVVVVVALHVVRVAGLDHHLTAGLLDEARRCDRHGLAVRVTRGLRDEVERLVAVRVRLTYDDHVDHVVVVDVDVVDAARLVVDAGLERGGVGGLATADEADDGLEVERLRVEQVVLGRDRLLGGGVGTVAVALVVAVVVAAAQGDARDERGHEPERGGGELSLHGTPGCRRI